MTPDHAALLALTLFLAVAGALVLYVLGQVLRAIVVRKLQPYAGQAVSSWFARNQGKVFAAYAVIASVIAIVIVLVLLAACVGVIVYLALVIRRTFQRRHVPLLT